MRILIADDDRLVRDLIAACVNGATFIENPFDPQTLIDTVNRLLPDSEE